MKDAKSNFGRVMCSIVAIFVCFVILLSFTFFHLLAASPSVQASKHNTDGNRYYSLGEYKKAADEYSEMTKLLPDSPDGYYLRAMTYAKMKEFDKSIADYTHVLKMNSTTQSFSSSHYNRGLAYKSKHNYRQAIEDFNAVLKWNPTDRDANVSRSDCYRLQGDPNTGVVENEQEYRNNAQEFGRLIASGSGYLNQKQYSDAASEFSAAIRLNPSDASGWASLAWTQYLQGHLTSAIKVNKTALKIDPYMSMAGVNMGLFYAVQSNWPAAKTYYQAAVKYAGEADFTGANQDIVDAKERYSSATHTLELAASFLQDAKTAQDSGKQ